MLKNHGIKAIYGLKQGSAYTFSRVLSTKPFFYQPLFEHAKELNIPFKKLTSKKSVVCIKHNIYE